MPRYKTDKEWEKWGQEAPWYGVLSEAPYRNKKLDKATRDQFYATGEGHVAAILAAIRQWDPAFKPKTVVDFGCGTGRLVFPFAKVAKQVWGIDISPSMIAEAKRNKPKGMTNVEFVIGDGSANLPPTYNLIHSAIVFQHMSPQRGYDFTARFLENLEVGGFAALHYTVYDSSPGYMKLIRASRRRFKLINILANVYKRRPLDTPNMQMNMYDLGHLAKIFYDNGITDPHILISHPDCYVGVQIIGKKTK